MEERKIETKERQREKERQEERKQKDSKTIPIDSFIHSLILL